jgi:hypothetical protein
MIMLTGMYLHPTCHQGSRRCRFQEFTSSHDCFSTSMVLIGTTSAADRLQFSIGACHQAENSPGLGRPARTAPNPLRLPRGFRAMGARK